jgi:hypothetical protein
VLMRVNVTQAERLGSKVGEGTNPFWVPGDPACADSAPTDSASARSNPLARVASSQASALPRTGNGPLIRRVGAGAPPSIVVGAPGTTYPCRRLVPGYARLSMDAAGMSWSARPRVDDGALSRLLIRFIRAAVVDAERLLRVLVAHPELLVQARGEVIRLTVHVYDDQGRAR